jgi:hypothetical protein
LQIAAEVEHAIMWRSNQKFNSKGMSPFPLMPIRKGATAADTYIKMLLQNNACIDGIAL